jgi:drug/metabolite transporter (DMT)-like permease
MPSKWYLCFPLAAAVLYALSAVAMKSAERRGVRAMHITVLSNFALAAAFLPFYPWREFPALPAVLWPAVALGAAFAAGQVLMIIAFARGEVSVATPALGTKAIFVAVVAATFASRPVAPATWVAAALMAAGLWLLVGRPKHADARRVAFAVVCSLAAALAFACFDVLVQVWGRPPNFGRFVPIGVVIGAVLSVPLLWLPARPAGPAPADPRRPGWPLFAGVALLSVQSLLLIWSIGRFQDAPGANIVYASRGVWSVLLVQALAGRAGAAERFESNAEFLRRLLGAGVMLLGVILVFAA